jgi:guanine deaminase
MVTLLNDPTMHAEMSVIRNACKKLGTFKLDGLVIYSSCEPCPMCLGAIYWARL